MQPAKANGASDLSEGLRLIMRGGGPKMLAAGLSLALIVGLAFVSTIEANNRAHHSNLSANGSSGSGSGDNGVAGGSGGSGGAANGPTGGASATGVAAGAGGGSASGGGGPGAKTGGGATGANTTLGVCPGNNPDIGVTCNQILVGGITVLSGPLGIYGEQGLQAAQAWLSFYNAVYAPTHHLRQEKLVYYDDHGADPSQDAILTQKLIEQDHVFAIGGMPAPQGANPYLVQHRIPLIGDLGLNPISYQSPMIFPTAPTPNVQAGTDLEAKVVEQKFHPKHIGAIISPLPGQDPAPLEQNFKNSYGRYGTQVSVQVMTTSESDCNSHLLQIKNANPDFLVLPVVSNNFLLCIQAAQSQNYYPGSGLGGGIHGWMGGSGISVEMQQCGSLCATAGGGIFSYGALFYDPTQFSNHDPNSGMDLYNTLMSKYAPNVDKTSIISLNYFAGAMVNSLLLAQAAATAPYLTRDHVIQLANQFKLDTGMGLNLDWADPPNSPNAHIGTVCGFPEQAVQQGGGSTWHVIPTKICGG
jgi:ABC-type branched-subunit amino acid transport system substrate-binding protein